MENYELFDHTAEVLLFLKNEIDKIEKDTGIANRLKLWGKIFPKMTKQEADFIEYIFKLDDEVKMTFIMAKSMFEEEVIE